MEADIQHIERLINVVKDSLRHKHYSRTVKLRKTYRQLVLGENIDDLLKQFVRREDEVLFKQRVELTTHIVTAVCQNLLNVFYKIPRSTTAKKKLIFEDSAKDNAEALTDILSTFWGKRSWDDYVAVRYIELNSVDPNAFIALTWDDYDHTTERLRPYPVEISSDSAIDYKYSKGVLEYLIYQDTVQGAEESRTIEFGTHKINLGSKVALDRYTLLTKTAIYTLTELTKDAKDTGVFVDNKLTEVTPGEFNIIISSKYYRLKAYAPHDLESVPAIRVGYKRDLVTEGETFVNPLDPVQPFLIKTIKSNSELDLVATLLALPQLIGYFTECDDVKCLAGRYQDGSKCNTCDGLGVKPLSFSAQDAIMLPMPRSKEELIPVGEVFKYIHPPVDIVKWQEDYIDGLTDKAYKFLFNSENYTKKDVAETATGRNLDYQNIYDTLYPAALGLADFWREGVNLIASLTDLDDGLTPLYIFSRDFKMKSLSDLVEDLRTANEIGNTVLAKHINADIVTKLFADNPTELKRYRIQESFNPFSGNSDVEATVLLASNYVTLQDKVLFANLDKIFRELEDEALKSGRRRLYDLPRRELKKMVDARVEEIIAAIQSGSPTQSLDI